MLEYDAALKQAAERFGTESQSYRDYRDQLRRWKNRESIRIDTEYYMWDQPIAEGYQRPTYEMLFGELRQAATPGTKANIIATKLNPEMVDFLQFSLGLWDMAREKGLEQGFGDDWWRVSAAEQGERAQYVHALRTWFFDGVQRYTNQLEDQARDGAEWVTEYIFARLVRGAEWKQDLFIEVEEPPAPLPRTGDPDWQPEEIDSPVGLEMSNG